MKVSELPTNLIEATERLIKQEQQIKELKWLLIEVESVEGHYNGVVFSEDLQDRLSDTIMKLNKH